jgi:serine/threonine protein phosphatase 1
MTDLTEGRRVYAIGDIHGCSALLSGMLGRVEADLAARPHPHPLLVFLGDYVDRGPDSRGTIDRLIAVGKGSVPARFLLGNHDAMLLTFVDAPEDLVRPLHWLDGSMGGAETLGSYGVAHRPGSADLRPSHAAFVAALPAAHRTFLESCERLVQVGGYAFAHAGIRPGVALAQQDADDLIWIREPFLSSSADHGVKVVHGHTIVPEVEHHRNRIAVDTGAVKTGVLSCVVLEGAEVGLLGTEDLMPLPERGGPVLDRLGRRLAEGMRLFRR